MNNQNFWGGQWVLIRLVKCCNKHALCFQQCLREINNMIRTGIAPKRGRYVVQLDNVEEEGEDGPSAKRHRSAMDIRLNSLMNDRIMAVRNKK